MWYEYISKSFSENLSFVRKNGINVFNVLHLFTKADFAEKTQSLVIEFKSKALERSLTTLFNYLLLYTKMRIHERLFTV